MSGITVVSADDDVERRLLEVYGRDRAIRRVWSPAWRNPGDAADEVCAADPEVVVIAPDVETADAADLTEEIDRRFPGSGVLVLIDHPDNDQIVDLLRLGARDVLISTPPNAELRAAVDRVQRLADTRRSTVTTAVGGGRRRVIVVASPKGGSGKTTIATNLALGLVQAAPNQVLLVDLDVQFGDCASALGLSPEHSLTQATAAVGLERSALKVFLTPHPSGLAVLVPPDDLADAEDLGAEPLKRTLGALVEEFPYVVIDTAAGIDERALLAMEFATDLLFVSTTDVPAVKALGRQLRALDAIALNGPRRHFLLNRSDARVGLTVADIEATIGMAADLQVPSSRSFPISTNEGVPLITAGRRDAAVRSLVALVDRFGPVRRDDRAAAGRWFRRT